MISTTIRILTSPVSICLTYISYLCDLPQFSGGVWHSSPQWEPCRKPSAEWKWSSTDPWPSWRDLSRCRGGHRSESTSGCWSTATLRHAAPWITRVGGQMFWDPAFQNDQSHQTTVVFCCVEAANSVLSFKSHLKLNFFLKTPFLCFLDYILSYSLFHFHGF